MQACLLNRLRKHGLGHIAAQLQRLVLPSLRLRTGLVAEQFLTVGTSKFGGSPDLPAEVAWPSIAGKPLCFVAQLNMAEAAPFDMEHLLPDTGMLYLFVRTDDHDYPEAEGQVLYCAVEPSALEWADDSFLAPDALRLGSARVEFSLEQTLPDWLVNLGDDHYIQEAWDWAVPDVDVPTLTPDEQAVFKRLLRVPSAGLWDSGPVHRLLGHSDDLQDGSDPGYFSGEWSAWRMLFQIDTDDAIGLQWGLSGRAYYWMRLPDLQARNFTRLECGVSHT